MHSHLLFIARKDALFFKLLVIVLYGTQRKEESLLSNTTTTTTTADCWRSPAAAVAPLGVVIAFVWWHSWNSCIVCPHHPLWKKVVGKRAQEKEKNKVD